MPLRSETVGAKSKDLYGTARVKCLIGSDAASRSKRRTVFRAMDPNNNHVLSVAEVDRFINECWPELRNSKAILRAFYAADADNSGLIGLNEFRMLLKYLVFYTELWEKFAEIDTSGDGRLTEEEFVTGCAVVGGGAIEDAKAMYHNMDTDGDGTILFHEFTMMMARKLVVDDGLDEEMLAGASQSTDHVEAFGRTGERCRPGPWWKGRAKLKALTKKNPEAAKKRKELFKRINTDGDDSIDLEEASVAIKKMWPEFDNDDAIKMAFNAADRDGGGSIGKREMRLFIMYQLFYDDVWDMFKAMDVNADGRLSEKEFESFVGLDLIELDVKNPRAVFATMDRDQDGSVDLNEFTVWVAHMKFKDEDYIRDTERAFAVTGAPSGNAGILDTAFQRKLKDRGIVDGAIAVLLENDINDMGILRSITAPEFKELGIKLGTSKKLMKIARGF